MHFNPLVPELYCVDLEESLSFYIDVLGFSVLYRRMEDKFAMIGLEGTNGQIQLMLEQLGESRNWLAADLAYPFGRGMSLQMIIQNIDHLYQKIQRRGIAFFMEIEDVTYRIHDAESHVRQFIIQDRDGYLLRFQQDLCLQHPS